MNSNSFSGKKICFLLHNSLQGLFAEVWDESPLCEKYRNFAVVMKKMKYRIMGGMKKNGGMEIAFPDVAGAGMYEMNSFDVIFCRTLHL